MADRGPPAPAPKASRAKTAHQTKTREPPHKNTPKQNPEKTAPPLELKVVVVPYRTVGRTSPSLPTKPTIPTT